MSCKRKKRNPGANDQNFDRLTPKFLKKVYGGLKGEIRLAVLKKDLAEFCPSLFDEACALPLNILDAGGGCGPFSLGLAETGHHVVLCDISGKMLEHAQMECLKRQIDDRVTIIHSPVQDLAREHHERYDLVLCHAVLEWLTDPVQVINMIPGFIKKNGLISITFYNLYGTIFKNLLRTNYRKVIREEYAGWPGSLTPPNPLEPSQVINWLEASGLEVLCHSGMRVFHDYILDQKDKDRHPEKVRELELKFSRQMPFREMGRYQHIICRATS